MYYTFHLGGGLIESNGGCRRSCDKNKIVSALNLTGAHTISFPKQPLYTISGYGISYFFTNNKSDTVFFFKICKLIKNQAVRRHRGTVLKYVLIFIIFGYTSAFIHRLISLSSKFYSSFCTSSFYNQPSRSCGHPATKPMNIFSFSYFGLIRPLHFCYTSRLRLTNSYLFSSISKVLYLFHILMSRLAAGKNPYSSYYRRVYSQSLLRHTTDFVKIRLA